MSVQCAVCTEMSVYHSVVNAAYLRDVFGSFFFSFGSSCVQT